MLSGIIASPGIALGTAFVLKNQPITVNKKKILTQNVNYEIKKFLTAKKKTIKQLKTIKKNSKYIFNENEENIFEGHIMILEDTELEEEIIKNIQNNLSTADYSVEYIISQHINKINNLKNQYLRNRAIDIRDIGNRLLKNILNLNFINIRNINKKVILIAKDLTPSETAQINFQYILGFITDIGGETDHTSIIAKTLEIPAIVGTGNITKIVRHDDFIILDSINNQIFINPNDHQIKTFQKRKNEYFKKIEKLNKFKKLPATTRDNHKVTISANISNINEIKNAIKYGAESIGLYRTEFLFMERKELPSENEQFEAYKYAAIKMNNKSVMIRTVDIGGDKEIPYMNFPKEENPFLGWRAIRISLDKKNMLHTQLKAILRASIFGKLKILFPMIISMEEILKIKYEIQKVEYELNKKKIPFDQNIQIGIMIETPASVIIANHLIKEVDFFSIGTNDLTQYTLAVDRRNELISHLYNPMSPSVIQSIKRVIDISHQENKWTGMCGEFAGNEQATMLLLGMGLDEFSMSPSIIPKIKKIIRKITFNNAYELSQLALKKSTIKEIKQLINYYIL